MEKLLHNYLISQVPLASALTRPETASLKSVVEAMRAEKVGSVVTLKGSKVHGIFTERDFLMKVIDENADWNRPISEFTTPDPITMESDEPLRKAIYTMKKKNFRHIPILEKDGSVRGVLSIRNVIRLFAEHFPAEVMNLPPRLHQQSSTQEGG